MPEHFAVGVTSALSVYLFIGANVRVRRARHLEDKLRSLAWSLGVQAVAVLVVVVSLSLVAAEPLPAAPDEAREVLKRYRRGLFALGLVLLPTVPAVVHVLRELASFVFVHRTDLLARDQAASFVGPARRSDG